MSDAAVRDFLQTELALHAAPPSAALILPAPPSDHGPPVIAGSVVLALLVAVDSGAWIAVPELFSENASALRYILPAALLGIILTALVGGYTPRIIFSFRRQLACVIAAGATAIAMTGGAAMLFGPGSAADGRWLAAIGATLAALAMGRVGLAALAHLDPSRRFAPRTVLIGGGVNARRLIRHLYQGNCRTVRLLGCVNDHPPEQDAGPDVIPYLGPVEQAFRLIRQGAVDQVILAMPWSAEQRVLALLGRLADYPVHVRLAPDLIGYRFAGCASSDIAGVALVHVLDSPISGWSSVLKRAEDLLIGVPMLALCAVPMLLIAALVRLDTAGPVLFRQRRTGFNDRDFTMLKFRTMRHQGPGLAPPAIVQAARGDARVTRIGRWLRRSSLDELPQLLNVLRGEMSVVGPRPHAPGTRAGGRRFERVMIGYTARHRVRPGLTGLAQVRGLRGETDSEEALAQRVESDLEYIRNWSLWLDLTILLRTLAVVLGMKNAH